jgi:hypothetical protein
MYQHPQHPQHHGRRRSAATTAFFSINVLIPMAILMGLVFGASQSVWAQDQPIVFAAAGDVPYSTSEISEFQEHMDSLDLYSGAEFLVHLGDIKAGSGSCTESWYQSMAASLRTLSIPAFIVPGDNEWNDCSNPTQAWGFWVKHLMAIEQIFCGLPVVERQAVRPENFAFVKSGVLFIGINKVSGGLGSGETQTRLQQDADWIAQQVQQKGNTVRALVIFAQARPSGSLESGLAATAAAFGKPVLYIHGDGHSWTNDQGYLEPNITKVQVDRTSISHPPVHVTVTMDPNNAFVFNRDPWPNGTTPVNKPPCANAGPDKQIASGASTVLNGTMSDDGEPTTAPLQVTWTHVAGQGIVTFTNPNAASTTATFSYNDNYTLRMTVSDGALTSSDTVVIAVGVTPNAEPTVTISAPDSGAEFNVGQTVTFNGSASDDVDTGLTASLQWTSSLDGNIGTGGTISTSALSLGQHTITASVTDSGGRTGFQSIIVNIVNAPTGPPPSSSVEVRVASSSDDAEESATGSVSLTSSDLELVVDRSNQTVGMRFNGVAIQKGATISNAWIQFQTDQVSTGAVSLTIRGQAADNATTFTTAAANISSRPKTTAAVSWSPADWTSVGTAGDAQRTGNLSSVIQEIVNRPGWASGNSLAILINGTGKRVAEAFNGVANAAPLLHIESAPSDPAPDIDVNPNPYGFGAVLVNTTATGALYIRNVGTQELQVDAISLTGTDAGQFAIAPGSVPFTVAPDATHNLDVTFTPTSVGSKTATVQLTSNDPNEGSLNVALTGSGSTPTEIEVSPLSHNYGGVSVGASGVGRFTVTNLGGANLQVTGTSLTGPNANQFAITAGGGSFTLATGASRNIDVSFSPTSAGDKNAALQLVSNDQDEGTLDLLLNGSGTTAPEINVTPSSHSYGAQQLGSEVTQTFTIANTGSSDLVVQPPTLTGPDAGSFDFPNGATNLTIAPQVSGSIQVRFRPTTEGSKSAILTIPNNDSDEPAVAVSLTGSGFVPGAAPPTFMEVQQGGSASSTTVTTSAPVTGVNGHLYLAAVSSKSPRVVTAMTGLGLTWTRLVAQCAGRNQTGVEVWWARGAATTGTVTATLASAASNAVIAVARYSGVAVTNPVAVLVAGNTNGVNGACASGTDSNAYAFNVTTTQSNVLMFGAVASRNKAHTPGAGYTERVEALQGTSSGDAVRVSFVERAVPGASTLPFNGTLSSTTDWAVVGVVLRP